MNKPANITWDAAELNRYERWARLCAHGATLWMTGLSGSGKSTIARALERRLVEEGVFAIRLDGDNIRHGLCADLDFSAAARAENIRRITEVAKLLAEAGAVVITSFISPYAKDRDAARAMHAEAELDFLEIFVDTPIQVCESRDPKGLYAKARAGEITGFTGVDDPYEPPASPDVRLAAATASVDACVDQILRRLEDIGVDVEGGRSPNDEEE